MAPAATPAPDPVVPADPVDPTDRVHRVDAIDAGASTPLLRVRGLSKSFPGVRALRDVDLDVAAGEVHALVGENGAGKSTLIKLVTGVERPDGGTMTFLGQPLAVRSPHEAQARGIATIYQEVNVVPDLSVAENLFLGRQPRRGPWLDWRGMARRSATMLAAFDVHVDVRQPIGELPVAVQQMVTIARAVHQQSRLLVLDEPTSSLDRREVETLLGVVRRLRDGGLGLVFVSHFLDQVYAVADRVTVLRDGCRVGTWRTTELPRRDLVAAMLGRERGDGAFAAASMHDAAASVPAPAVLLQAHGLARDGAVGPLDLDVRAGEVLGLAGLLGAGRTALARLLFGADRPTAGRLRWRGRAVTLRSPRDAVRLGIAFCPEDRKLEGLFPSLSVRENLTLVVQRTWSRAGRAHGARQRALSEEWVRRLRIATPSIEQPIGLLSGGNQQKVILARWLAARPALLIQDEPTRGIDIGAKAELEALTAELAAAGMAVVLVSSELDEVVRACDRIAVLVAGRVAVVLQRPQASAAALIQAMAQHAPAASGDD